MGWNYRLLASVEDGEHIVRLIEVYYSDEGNGIIAWGDPFHPQGSSEASREDAVASYLKVLEWMGQAATRPILTAADLPADDEIVPLQV